MPHNRSVMLRNLVVEVPYGRGNIPIRIQIHADRVMFTAAPMKGEPRERQAIRFIAALCRQLQRARVAHSSCVRDVGPGRKIVDLVSFRLSPARRAKKPSPR